MVFFFGLWSIRNKTVLSLATNPAIRLLLVDPDQPGQLAEMVRVRASEPSLIS